MVGTEVSAMKVLVATASKHGATSEIGSAIALALREQDIEVTEMPAAEVTSVDDFEAVVIGSGVYAGRWLAAARELIKRENAALRGRLVWLFSSGPIGDPPKPESDPVDVQEMIELSGAREHKVFAGRIDRAGLGFGERAIVTLLKAPEGDYRPWSDVQRWSTNIADELRGAVVTV
jgi:menaquinone-dependent protoporphyrinogen oxidase